MSLNWEDTRYTWGETNFVWELVKRRSGGGDFIEEIYKKHY